MAEESYMHCKWQSTLIEALLIYYTYIRTQHRYMLSITGQLYISTKGIHREFTQQFLYQHQMHLSKKSPKTSKSMEDIRAIPPEIEPKKMAVLNTTSPIRDANTKSILFRVLTNCR